jgi:hypothetical protein
LAARDLEKIESATKKYGRIEEISIFANLYLEVITYFHSAKTDDPQLRLIKVRDKNIGALFTIENFSNFFSELDPKHKRRLLGRNFELDSGPIRDIELEPNAKLCVTEFIEYLQDTGLLDIDIPNGRQALEYKKIGRPSKMNLEILREFGKILHKHRDNPAITTTRIYELTAKSCVNKEIIAELDGTTIRKDLDQRIKASGVGKDIRQLSLDDIELIWRKTS